MKSSDELRADFDRIARALSEGGHAGRDDSDLLGLVPENCRRALEIGCGDGRLTRGLAERSEAVDAIDLSPAMIALAKRDAPPNINFRVDDVMLMPLDLTGYDFVVAVAVLHHLPFEAAVRRMAALVRPGGVLVIRDLIARKGVLNLPLNLVAFGAKLFVRRESHAVREAYEEHGAREDYLTPSEARQRFTAILPGAHVQTHLLWRYTMMWMRSGGTEVR